MPEVCEEAAPQNEGPCPSGRAKEKMITKPFTMYVYKDIPKWQADLKAVRYLELLGYKVEQIDGPDFVTFNFYRKEGEEFVERKGVCDAEL